MEIGFEGNGAVAAVNAERAQRMDARVKILLTGVYAVCLFFVDSWLGMAGMAAILFLILMASGIEWRRVFGSLGVVYALAGLTMLFNALMPVQAVLASGMPGLFGPIDAADAAMGANPLNSWALVGWDVQWGVIQLGFSVGGLLRGCFFAARLLLLVWSSLLLAHATPVSDLTDALIWFLTPLRVFHAPLDDIAMVLQIAIRFIPVTVEEFDRVRLAQLSRGAALETGPLFARFKAWAGVFVPILVGLFRRADRLGMAMDARCYGATAVRTRRLRSAPAPSGWAVAVVAMAACVSLALFL